MEYFKKNQEGQKKSERFIVVLFTLYSLNLFISMVRKEAEVWLPALILIGILAAWIINISKYRNFRVRAVCISVIMQIMVILYAANTDSLSETIPTFMAILIIIAFYGFTDLLFLTLISALLIISYHGIVIKSFAGMSAEEIFRLAAQLGNIFCAEFVLYIWIKKRNERHEQMYQIIDALMDAEKSKDDFLANVSHEIRTPVNTICGMSEMTLREHDPEKMRDEILDIRDAGHNLMSLVSDILDFSQLQQGKMNIEEEAYNITSTVNDIINMAMARKENKQVELIVDCDANIPSGLLGDEKKIRRVIMNLVNNAIKYTSEGGIVIRVYTRKEEYGVNLCVSVKDTGIGMSEEELENVFESFSQVDTRRNRQEGGVGLGLAISKALLQKMGGVITVRSRLGKGSDFRFVVPQKVLDEKPITQVKDREKLNIAAYFDMEQFDMMAIRDEYSTLIMHMVKQLRVRCHVCRNLAELKRREEIEAFTHIFISLEEYQEDEAYFNELAKKTSVAVVIERFNDKFITNEDVIRLYKPFYILPVVSILNGSREAAGGKQMVRPGKFTAPDAHVLVVDDNRMNIRVVEGLLKEYQIKVTYATSGHEALDVIENMSYDFVFMDHMMPEMDGIETLHRIRDKVGRYYQTVPIIALTANAAPGNREMFLEEGFDDFVEKPLEISVLERVLKRNLPEEKIVYNDVHDVKAQDGEPENKEIEQEKDVVSAESGIVIGDLDVEKGILYCGSEKAYLEILENCYEEGAQERALIEKLFEDKNWKDYTIKVHAIKSTMKSIGANVLFEKAKALETAGRNNDIDYIMKNHNDMLDEHRRVMNELAQSPLLNCKTQESIHVENDDSLENNAAFEEMPELGDETLDKLLGEMEDAAYSLDGEGMLNVLSEMQKYRYCDVCLKDKLSSVGKKIEKSDLMSALDNVSKICNDLKNKQKGDSAE